ncbi:MULTISPECIES: hypothetical protein [unclassified Streptomyces]|uniref:hypothetical protein n=1 Tax=unclassified Streptomyces TaxID=2593676 RepID=UPI00332CD298
MRTSTRVAGVLAGLALTLTLGGAIAAPAAQADIPACVQMAGQAIAGGSAGDAVTAACTRGVSGDLQGCVSGLTAAGVPGGAANGACRLAAHEPR